MTNISRQKQAGFVVQALDEDENETALTAQRILLAVGKRGSPRKLPVEAPSAMEGRVFYSLADARSVAGQELVVVGLGDVAMEAAIALSRQPDTRVVVVHRGSGFGRGQSRNIEEFQRRVEAGAIDLRLETTVCRIEDGSVVLSSHGEERAESCDGLFVLIGSIPLTNFLTRVGVLPGHAEMENQK